MESTVEPGKKQPQYLYRDQFLLTNDKSYLDPASLNDAMASLSDMLWWTSPMEVDEMQTIIDKGLNYAIFAPVNPNNPSFPRDGTDGLPLPPPARDLKLVGFSRLVTDFVTFAYLTDVFVVDGFQRRGFARWMMQAIKDELDSWPRLRSLMIMTMNQAAIGLYEEVFGVRDIVKTAAPGLALLEMAGKSKKTKTTFPS